MDILTIDDRKHKRFLKKKTKPIDLEKLDELNIKDLISNMRSTMRSASGVGLSANQIGLNMRLFVAEVPYGDGEGTKFYAILNPKILKTSSEKGGLEEGCLSIPDMYGYVMRAQKITLEGYDAKGRKLKIKAWGFLARVFQHEVDHLDGKLFLDRTKEVHTAEEDS